MNEKNVGIKIPTSWRIKRYYLFIFLTVVSLVLPWIKIDESYFFLLNFDKLELHLAFVKFDMQELYLLPFLLMILFLGIFGMTVMGGRVFCGWICPQTIFRVIYRDLIETKLLKLRKRIKNKQLEPDMSIFQNKIKKAAAILIWTALAFLASADLIWYFVPPEDFFNYLANPLDHMILVGTLAASAIFLIYDIVFLQEDYCIYVCPYSRVQSVLYDENTVMALYNTNRGGHIYDEHKVKQFTKQKDIQVNEPHAECTACESCVTVCPTHIDIRKGLQLECINCLECVDACTVVMGKLGKPSLVTWSSEYETIDKKGKTQYLRPKIIAYIVLLVGLLVGMVFMGGNKEHMLLNINKENRLYSVQKTGDGRVAVDNAYEFLMQNTQNDKMSFYFEVILPKDVKGKVEIFKPKEAFDITPGVKKKKIVVLRTYDALVEDGRHDTIIPITIRAYALGHEDKIVVFRESTFTYPRADVIKNIK
ncbi:MAG: cytochrome c oxidase accessory protein CcoG [Sulfurimonas sp. RIFCSPLOWO2_12_FULL_36_74]|uniref:cytochrome c oxidase accessory protein CcoG n=1 Tax=Sulfurimonas sp. RIFCSPLOWO2_12_36_12 TaxID=1802253 RepID=UPI0008C39414|nr:cytochrome c oxidase accessory protein CcoG [Sulfurimonas sp. RIFCSPLOWO2_12_36_12]OHE00146.1 MAG: cytochrome c oxidase accessory protein CcoG [Sulfurimonas sp. RIFCSPLOWO2_12_36_12]OHE08629.1 MAG: cytochrome c oxidase accessory protein CcoG [Sulfurimonas sp. RIFCSPLOWO2_12_FULL_36_74]